MPRGRTKESGGGAQADGGKGELEEGGGWTLYSGHHSGQQPTGVTSGQCIYYHGLILEICCTDYLHMEAESDTLLKL